MTDSRLTSFSITAWRGPVAVAIVVLTMLVWSWQTWTDPLVDFGTQLYVPWQMTAGKVVYRDLAYYNSPLSQYFHAGLFELFGVSLRVLVLANLAVLTGVLILIDRLARRASGPIAAVVCGISFAMLFAFGQGVGVANYNWVTPYTNEITDGIALGLLAIILLNRYQRTRHHGWLTAAGITVGLVFLTKAEPFVATLAATVAMLAADARARRRTAREILIDAAIFISTAVVVPLIAVGLMSLQMPVVIAARGVAGSWPWAFDRRVTALAFYRRISGTDHVADNLLAMLRWSLIYAAVVGFAVVVGLRMRRPSRATAVILFALLVLTMAIGFHSIDWGSIIRPLPVCLLVGFVILLIAIARRSMPADVAVLRFGLVVFATALVSKISLNAEIPHYGFALAMPGVLIVTAVAFEILPKWIVMRGGDPGPIRAVAAAGWIATVGVTLYMDNLFFSSKQWTIGRAGDTLRVDQRGEAVGDLVEYMRSTTPERATLAVLPQGLMVNYLTRRADPIPYLNFMPPEVLAVGEDRIVTALAARPPDVIVIDTASVNAGDFTMDVTYHYGHRTLAWVLQNYHADPHPGRFRVMLRN